MAQWNKNNQSYRAQDTTNFEVVMIADEDGNISNSFGAAANIPISAGELSGYSHINKFGFSSNIGFGGGYHTIWNSGGLYSYASSATIAAVTSDDALDNGAVITLTGLDANYLPVTEDITIGGAAGTQLFLRVYRALVKTPSAGQSTNVGKISISVDSGNRAEIFEGNGQTLMAVYTVPAGKTGYLMKLQASPDKNTDVLFKLVTREFNGAFLTKGLFGTFGVPVAYDYPVPLRFPEKTDIEIQGKAGNTCAAGAVFDVILVDNP
mgnify:CR=1 FL=1